MIGLNNKENNISIYVLHAYSLILFTYLVYNTMLYRWTTSTENMKVLVQPFTQTVLCINYFTHNIYTGNEGTQCHNFNN